MSNVKKSKEQVIESPSRLVLKKIKKRQACYVGINNVNSNYSVFVCWAIIYAV